MSLDGKEMIPMENIDKLQSESESEEDILSISTPSLVLIGSLLDVQDLLLEISQYLGDSEDLSNLSRVCVAFANVSIDPRFWKSTNLTFENLHSSGRPIDTINRLLIHWCDHSDSEKNQFDPVSTHLLKKHLEGWKLYDLFEYRILCNQGILYILDQEDAPFYLDQLLKIGYPLRYLLFQSKDDRFAPVIGSLRLFDIYTYAICTNRLDIVDWIQKVNLYAEIGCDGMQGWTILTRTTSIFPSIRLILALILHKWEICNIIIKNEKMIWRVRPEFVVKIIFDLEIQDFLSKNHHLVLNDISEFTIWNNETNFADFEYAKVCTHSNQWWFFDDDIMNPDIVKLDEQNEKNCQISMSADDLVENSVIAIRQERWFPVFDGETGKEILFCSETDEYFSENDEEEECPDITFRNVVEYSYDELREKIKEYEEIHRVVLPEDIEVKDQWNMKKRTLDAIYVKYRGGRGRKKQKPSKSRIGDIKRSQLSLDNKYHWHELVRETLQDLSRHGIFDITPTAEMILQNAVVELCLEEICGREIGRTFGYHGEWVKFDPYTRNKDDYLIPDHEDDDDNEFVVSEDVIEATEWSDESDESGDDINYFNGEVVGDEDDLVREYDVFQDVSFDIATKMHGKVEFVKAMGKTLPQMDFESHLTQIDDALERETSLICENLHSDYSLEAIKIRQRANERKMKN